MIKISQSEAQKTTTMFVICNDIEEYYNSIIDARVDSLQNNLLGIGTKEGLRSYILSSQKSIEELITLMGLKQEKFKRVISWIRLSRGFIFDAEWDCNRVQRECKVNTEFCNIVCDLFMNGKNNPIFQKIIPQFILDEFCIDTSIVGRLSNRGILSSLVKEKLSTEYNSRCGNYYYQILESRIRSICSSKNCRLCKDVQIDGLSGVYDAIIKGGKYIIIKSMFYLTTSSSQTRYAKQIDELYRKCKTIPNVCLVNVLDGAGWIGRSSDYRSIYSSCHYFLNYSTIDRLVEIIDEFLK